MHCTPPRWPPGRAPKEGRGMGVKVEIPGVEVQGTLKPENLFDTLAALLSLKFDKRITVKTRPPAWMERAAQKEQKG